MAKRKTVKLSDIIDSVNRKNMYSTCSPEIRQGWNAMLADILHQANSYAGFGYYTQDQVPEGHEPGIIRNDDMPCLNQFPDETRRFYYYARHLG
jgi:hypothetical protein